MTWRCPTSTCSAERGLRRGRRPVHGRPRHHRRRHQRQRRRHRHPAARRHVGTTGPSPAARAPAVVVAASAKAALCGNGSQNDGIILKDARRSARRCSPPMHRTRGSVRRRSPGDLHRWRQNKQMRAEQVGRRRGPRRPRPLGGSHGREQGTVGSRARSPGRCVEGARGATALEASRDPATAASPPKATRTTGASGVGLTCGGTPTPVHRCLRLVVGAHRDLRPAGRRQAAGAARLVLAMAIAGPTPAARCSWWRREPMPEIGSSPGLERRRAEHHPPQTLRALTAAASTT